MNSAAVMASRSFTNTPLPFGESHPGNESSNTGSKLSSGSASSGSMETDERIGDVIRRRRRRQMRLLDDGESVNPSPSTIPEHQSINHHAHFENDKLLLSAASTSDTAVMSTMTLEMPDLIGQEPSAPTTGSTLSISEIDPIFHSTLMTTEINSPREMLPSLRGGTQLDDVRLHRNSVGKPSLAPISSKLCKTKQIRMTKSKDHSSRSKPELRRHSTAPESCVLPKQTDVLDNVLMDRAFLIRQRLINFEMQELAVEAEKAAESGLEKFVGSASKFGVEETPPYRPTFVDDADFVMSSMRANEGFATPMRQRNSFVTTLTQPMDYTPSYFSKKKLPVTKLRHISEIIPNFEEMHKNIRIHLGRKGVDTDMLPSVHTHRFLVKSNTDESGREDADDALSQVHSVAASHTGSISSFSSYAVASLTSLREILTSSSMTNYGRDNTAMTGDGPHPDSSRERKLHFSDELAFDRKIDSKTSSQARKHSKSSVGDSNSDSDDSSVEFYGRKTPSTSSDVREMSHRNLSLSKSYPGVNANKNTFQRLGSNLSGAGMSFETKNASRPAQFDHHNNVADTVSFYEDQRNHAIPSRHLEILPSTSSTRIANKATPMSNFLNKIQNQFSLTSSDGRQTSPKVVEEDNEYFLTNFLYTCQDSDNIDHNGDFYHVNLEINSERESETFCLQGCGPNDLLPACDTATKYADLVLDWFNNGGHMKSKKSSSIIDPDEQSMNPNWIKTWQTNESEEKNIRRRRIYTPPKLSGKIAAEQYDSSTFCSPSESVHLEAKCENAILRCNEAKQPLACPEFQNNIGWPPTPD